MKYKIREMFDNVTVYFDGCKHVIVGKDEIVKKITGMIKRRDATIKSLKKELGGKK